MIRWRRLSLILSITWHTKPLHIVPQQSAFFPSRSFTTTTSFPSSLQHRHHQSKLKKRPSSSSKPPVSAQELAVQQSIASRRLDQAKKQLMNCHGSNTLDRFNTWRPLLLLARKGRQPRDLAWMKETVERQDMTRQWGLVPDLFDMHALMYCYGVHDDIAGAERTLEKLLPAMGLTPSVFTVNTLLGCYQRNKAIDKALRVLEQQQPHLLDVGSYNTVLAMLDVDAQWDKAIQLYHNMPMDPDRYTFSTMLHVATQTNNSDLGLPIYQHLHTTLQQQLQLQHHHHQPKKKKAWQTNKADVLDIATVNAMMAFQISVMNNVDAALAIYDHLCTMNEKETGRLTPDTITCNILLDGLLKQRRNPGKTAAMVHQMEARGHLVPNHVTYGIMMEAEVIMGDLHGALALFEEALATVSTTDNTTMERMMGSLAKAAATLDHDQATMGHLWTSLATTTKTGYSLDVKAYNGLMHGLAKLGRADLAQALYDHVFRMHNICVADVATFTSLILAYINNDQVDDAMEIYYVLREQHYRQQEQLPQRQRQQQQQQQQQEPQVRRQQQRQRRPVIALDTIFYTTLISALTNNYKNNNHYYLDSALELFTDMRQLRIQPTLHIYTAMLHWCGRSGDLEGLEEVHRLIKMDMALDPDVGIYNALMDGYNRTDQIDQVLYLWDTMLTTSVGIDETTISIVLDACGHHNQPQRANMIWTMMSHRKDIKLMTNNYTSYVECLCRVGAGTEEARWWQALEVVRSMLVGGGGNKIPLPNSKTLNTLASFARKYGLNSNKDVVEQLDSLELEFRKRSLLD